MPTLERNVLRGATVLKLNGSLTYDQIRLVQREFETATHDSPGAVVVDLSNVDMLTTPAISMFLAAARELKDGGRKIIVSGPQPRVGEILKRLRLDNLLPVCSTVEEGVERTSA